MLDYDISPISTVENTYRSDIATPEYKFGWDFDRGTAFPVLDLTNFRLKFMYRSVPTISCLKQYADQALADECVPTIEELFRKSELLRGDLDFAFSTKKFNANNLGKRFDTAEKICPIDHDGRENTRQETPFALWTEFKRENPQLVQQLVTLSNWPAECREKTHHSTAAPLGKHLSSCELKD